MKRPRKRPASARTPLGTTLALAALLASALSTAAAASSLPGGSPRPVVTVAQGSLRGQAHDGAREFLGVPYAAPPVGEARLRVPLPPPRWNGVREATRQAPACLQFSPFGLRDPSAVSEDCLYLDVYRPRTVRPGARLPVILWMHGGAYSQGTGTQFGGPTMADLTRSVVVSINYRLGQLGYLALPDLGGENDRRSGSFGLMDQIEALRWTRENIGAFGGDPGSRRAVVRSARCWPRLRPPGSSTGPCCRAGRAPCCVRPTARGPKRRRGSSPDGRGASIRPGWSRACAAPPVFDEGDRRIFGSLEPAKLSDGWAMAVFSVPESERSYRYQLRTRLTWLGFGNIAPGVWLAPGRLLDDARDMLIRRGLSDYVHLFAADYAAFSDLPETVSSWWDFPAIQAQYATFTQAYDPVAAAVAGQRDIDGDEAFRHYVPMLTQWRRLPYLDPGLPSELLPANWNAVAARQIFQQLHDVLATPSLSHVQHVTGLAEVPPEA